MQTSLASGPTEAKMAESEYFLDHIDSNYINNVGVMHLSKAQWPQFNEISLSK
jgi:hypothetical protein